MTIHDVSYDNVLRYRWDTEARTLTEFDDAGKPTSVRPMTALELDEFARDAAAVVAEGNRSTLSDRARRALADNATFLAIGAPSNAQVLAQVRALTRQMNAVIRLQIGSLDDITGT